MKIMVINQAILDLSRLLQFSMEDKKMNSQSMVEGFPRKFSPYFFSLRKKNNKRELRGLWVEKVDSTSTSAGYF